METFRVGLSGDFLLEDGSPAFPMFDLAPLERPDVEYFYLPRGDAIQADDVADVDALILLQPNFNSDSVHQAKRLSLVARFGVGYDTVDVDACTESDIALVITPDGVRRPVAVSIITLLLALTGKLADKSRIGKQGPDGWATRADFMGVGLEGLTFGSIGFGNIGQEAFRMAAPFGMRFIASDPYADKAAAKSLDVTLVDTDTVFREADVVSISCFLNEQTRNLVNAQRLSLMKPSAYLINTARGPIVDQAALTRALGDGTIAGAGLDVLEREPPDASDPILSQDNVIITPHSLCWTDQCFAGNGAADVRAALGLMRGEPPVGIVNRAITERAGWQEKLARYRTAFGAR